LQGHILKQNHLPLLRPLPPDPTEVATAAFAHAQTITNGGVPQPANPRFRERARATKPTQRFRLRTSA
jgi:hypothetical protein